MKRTIAIKLNPSPEQARLLGEVQRAFSEACNLVVPFARNNKAFNNVKLHHLAYYAVRGQSRLGSQMICQAIKSVAGKYKALRIKKSAELPTIFFKPKSVHYDKRTYTLKEGAVSLYTLEGRTTVPIVFGKHQKGLFDQGLPKEAELVSCKGHWFFNLVVELPDVETSNSTTVVGIDLGENNIAATSTGKIIGGGKLRYDRDRFLALRRRLQRNGSQSAKQLLKRISGKEARHVKQINHLAAKQIVAEAINAGAGYIAMENLTHIRKRIKAGKRVRSRLHRWAWFQLQQFVEYKAAAAGILVLYINPAYSSKTCHQCGAIATRNKHRFSCICGNRAHSDLNASRNLARLGETAVSPRGVVNRPNVAA